MDEADAGAALRALLAALPARLGRRAAQLDGHDIAGLTSRVALARILLTRSNLLLLDEPTNPLALASAEARSEALRGYDGTMLFVSHDRSFLNGLATRIWEVKDGGVVDWPGNLDDWLYHQRDARERTPQPGTPAAPAPPGPRGGAPTDRERRRQEAEERNARNARQRPLRDAIARLEARIAELEAAQRAAEAALADPALYEDFARARPHVEALAAAKEELARLYPEWEARQAELEALAAG
jgi:ATP-binding cassette subfamily F protein 3